MTSQIKGTGTSTFGGNVDVTGNVITDAPAFSAYASANGTLSNAAWTKVTFDIEQFDTNSNYDTTLSRFTPTVEGYYQFNASVSSNGSSNANYNSPIGFRKNGSEFARGTGVEKTAVSGYTYWQISHLIYMNGTTDYLEVYIYQSSGASITIQGGNPWQRIFNGFLARAV